MARKIEHVQVRFAPASADELRAIGDKPEGYVAGWASTDALDACESVIEAGAFEESIAERGLTGPKGVKFLCDHNWSRVAGRIVKLEQKGNRLWIEAEYNLKVSYARDQYEAAKMNGGLSFSVGFYIKSGAPEKVEGKSVYRITKADLIEVSAVAFPANEDAIMTEIKNNTGPIDSISDFEKFLVSTGLAESRNAAQRLTQVVKRNVQLFVSERTEDAPAVSKDVTAPPVSADEAELAQLLDMLRSERSALAAIAGDKPQGTTP